MVEHNKNNPPAENPPIEVDIEAAAPVVEEPEFDDPPDMGNDVPDIANQFMPPPGFFE